MKDLSFAPDKYFRRLYALSPLPFDGVSDADGCREVINDIKKRAEDIFALDKIPFKADDPAVSVIKTEKRKGYTVEKLSVGICTDLFMLCYALIPDTPDKSGIAALCGHGYGARQIIRQSKAGKLRKIDFFDDYQKNFAEALAQNGHTVIVPEFIGFGEARLKKDSFKPFYASSCDTVSHHALPFGFSAASMRIYQTMKCVDLLTGRYGCEDIGCMGISGGGLVALYTSVLDERIKNICVCGYINTFSTSIFAMWHCPDNYIPGLYSAGDMYDFACALAPRRLMMQAGKNDKLFPADGSVKAVENIKRIYALSGAEDRFIPVVFDGKHEVDLASALEFFNDTTGESYED